MNMCGRRCALSLAFSVDFCYILFFISKKYANAIKSRKGSRHFLLLLYLSYLYHVLIDKSTTTYSAYKIDKLFLAWFGRIKPTKRQAIPMLSWQL